MCHVLRVARSGYDAWQHRKSSVQQQRRERLVTKIRLIHKQSRQTYGSPRVHASLVCQGQSVCINTVAKLMKHHQIKAKTKQSYLPHTTDSRHAQPIASNVLDRQFVVNQPNQKWASDITYLRTDEGWLYTSRQ